MTIKERQLLFALNEQVKKLTQAPLTTNTPLTGQVPQEQPLTPLVSPLPIVIPPKPQG